MAFADIIYSFHPGYEIDKGVREIVEVPYGAPVIELNSIIKL